MLYFSKLRITLVSLVSIFFIFIAVSNFQNSENSFISKKINLGLDLQGGSYLLLEIDNGPVEIQKLQNTTTVIRNFLKDKKITFNDLRIQNKEIIFSVSTNDVGLVETFFLDKNSEINPYYPQYKSHQFDLLIGPPGAGNGTQAQFLLTLSKYGIIEIKTSSQDQALEIVRRRVDEVGTNEPNILKRGNNRILVELPGLDDPMRIKSLLGKTANLTFRFVTQNNSDTFGTEMLQFEDGTSEAMVSKRIILNGENLLDAQPQMNNQTNETVVSFTLDRVGAKRFGKATSTGVGKQLAIVLDGKIVSAPVIRDTIASGNGQISGNFTFQSATDLALLLRSGALPAPLNIIEERTVGPDLGQDSINAGVIALMIGFLLVIIFMFFKYKIFGLIANITLLINLFFLVGILTLFEATLTLPGIAGIILTVGMAVDANVLIFERIKEECKKEKNNIIAFDTGYVKSKTAIIDANITTLIAAVILFFMGSGPVKGFSVTLAVGIFTTLFSVYFIARMLTGLYVVRNKEKTNLI
ncbi:protein translocase subunit SecD [Candidatus Pelagibacter sp.]|nr:protein translocase subunit SecD [Candidatus Pelagibacter sp.]